MPAATHGADDPRPQDARQTVAPASREPNGLGLVVAWVAILLASDLFNIIWVALLGHARSPVWLFGAQFLVLLAVLGLTLVVHRLRTLRGFILALGGLALGQQFRLLLENTDLWTTWSQSAPAYQQIFADSLLALIPSGLVALTLIGSGLTRRDVLLTVGNPAAPAGMPFRMRPVSWALFGPFLIGVITCGLVIQLLFTVRPDFAQFSSALAIWPVILIFAVENALSEEFRFRCVLLARGVPILGKGQTMLLTSALFGLGHWFGHPSGPTGVVLAGIAGWVWAKSMLDTRGITWAWAIHGAEDVVILAFVAMTAVH